MNTWNKNNPEKMREARKRWELKHPERKRENRRRWYLANRAKAIESTRQWRLNNPEKRKAHQKTYTETHRNRNVAYRKRIVGIPGKGEQIECLREIKRLLRVAKQQLRQQP